MPPLLPSLCCPCTALRPLGWQRVPQVAGRLLDNVHTSCPVSPTFFILFRADQAQVGDREGRDLPERVVGRWGGGARAEGMGECGSRKGRVSGGGWQAVGCRAGPREGPGRRRRGAEHGDWPPGIGPPLTPGNLSPRCHHHREGLAFGAARGRPWAQRQGLQGRGAFFPSGPAGHCSASLTLRAWGSKEPENLEVNPESPS